MKSVPRQILRGLVKAVLIVCAFGCFIVLITPEDMFRRSEVSLRAACQNNEKQLWVVLQAYAKAHRGMWPALSPEIGVLMFDAADLVPAYMPERAALWCPSDESRTMADVLGGDDPGSYCYLGYIVRDDEAMDAFISAYRAELDAGGDFSGDLVMDGGGIIRQISDESITALGLELGDLSAIPVLFDVNKHFPGGVNVLFLDGHVEYIKIGERFPATPMVLEFIDTLGAAPHANETGNGVSTSRITGQPSSQKPVNRRSSAFTRR